MYFRNIDLQIYPLLFSLDSLALVNWSQGSGIVIILQILCVGWALSGRLVLLASPSMPKSLYQQLLWNGLLAFACTSMTGKNHLCFGILLLMFSRSWPPCSFYSWFWFYFWSLLYSFPLNIWEQLLGLLFLLWAPSSFLFVLLSLSISSLRSKCSIPSVGCWFQKRVVPPYFLDTVLQNVSTSLSCLKLSHTPAK